MDTPSPNKKTALAEYAVLHRAVEDGGATDWTWQNLIRVCIKLNKQDEAVDAFGRIADPNLRRGIRRDLAKRGWVSERPAEDETRGLLVTEADLNPSAREKLEDSVRYLFEGKMPWAVTIGTVAFPVVLGVGGVLTGGSTFFLLHIIALLPALLLLGMIGAVGHRVLALSIQGLDEGPDIPPLAQLVREAPRYVLEFVALSAIYLGPAIVLAVLGAPLVALPLIAVAGLLMPMATSLRLACKDWGALLSMRLFNAVRRTSPSYARAAGVTMLLFGPAAIAMLLTVNSPAFLAISVIGPLAVAPAFVSARMIGLTLHFERQELEGLFDLPDSRCARMMEDAPAGSKELAEEYIEELDEPVSSGTGDDQAY